MPKLNKKGEPSGWKNFDSKISKYFTVGDAVNHDVKRIPSNIIVKQRIKKLAKELDKLQEQFGQIQINSWYRPKAVNDAVGGASNSQHIQGWAADIELRGKNNRLRREFENWLNKNWKGGVGLGVASGKTYTHVDLGPNRRWTY
jgi:putative chitinase